MIAEAAEGAADEVHSAEQAAEMESVADQEVRGFFCFFSFFSSFSSCLLPLLSHAPSLHLPPSLSLSAIHHAGCHGRRGGRGPGGRGRVP